MNKTTMTVLATAVALSFGAAVLASSMTKPQFMAAKKTRVAKVDADYAIAKE